MPDLTNPMIMNMVKTMFDGFKIAIDLEVRRLDRQDQRRVRRRARA